VPFGIFRVEQFVTSLLPHRPVRADFPHTVPPKLVSLSVVHDIVLSLHHLPYVLGTRLWFFARSAICNSTVDTFLNVFDPLNVPQLQFQFQASPFPNLGLFGYNSPDVCQYYKDAKTAFFLFLPFSFPRSGYRLRYRTFLRSSLGDGIDLEG
jgi:hypothetical protein